VEREFRRLVEKLLKPEPVSSEPSGAIKAVRIRGERRLRYYRRQSTQIGEWWRRRWELITDEKPIRELRRRSAPRIIQFNMVAIPMSPVNAMFAALIDRLSSDRQGEFVLPEGVSESDWEFNVRRAKRLLAGKKGLTGPQTRLEIAKRLVRGANRCRSCGTFLIRGYRVAGRKITRAKEFCDKGCQMRAERRKKPTG
jgi:hypothetical protein